MHVFLLTEGRRGAARFSTYTYHIKSQVYYNHIKILFGVNIFLSYLFICRAQKKPPPAWRGGVGRTLVFYSGLLSHYDF